MLGLLAVGYLSVQRTLDIRASHAKVRQRNWKHFRQPRGKTEVRLICERQVARFDPPLVEEA